MVLIILEKIVIATPITHQHMMEENVMAGQEFLMRNVNKNACRMNFLLLVIIIQMSRFRCQVVVLQCGTKMLGGVI